MAAQRGGNGSNQHTGGKVPDGTLATHERINPQKSAALMPYVEHRAFVDVEAEARKQVLGICLANSECVSKALRKRFGSKPDFRLRRNYPLLMCAHLSRLNAYDCSNTFNV